MDELLVDNGDITLRVEVTGTGPAIVCVHGWPESPHSWRHQVAHFSERGYRVAAMDVRGYGGSSAPPEIERYTLKELASDVAAVAAAVDDEPVVLGRADLDALHRFKPLHRHDDEPQPGGNLLHREPVIDVGSLETQSGGRLGGPGGRPSYTRESAWWAFNRASVIAAQRWGDMRVDVAEVRNPLQEKYLASQEEVAATAAAGGNIACSISSWILAAVR